MYAAVPKCEFMAGRMTTLVCKDEGRRMSRAWSTPAAHGRSGRTTTGARGQERRQERRMNVADPDEAGPNAL